jgi:hypothetical protein
MLVHFCTVNRDQNHHLCPVDELLDERLAHRSRASEEAAVDM